MLPPHSKEQLQFASQLRTVLSLHVFLLHMFVFSLYFISPLKPPKLDLWDRWVYPCHPPHNLTVPPFMYLFCNKGTVHVYIQPPRVQLVTTCYFFLSQVLCTQMLLVTHCVEGRQMATSSSEHQYFIKTQTICIRSANEVPVCRCLPVR